MRIVNKFLKLNNYSLNKKEGQLMVIIAVLMAGLFVVGTAISGLLMYFSSMRSSDFISSGAAFFAADAGIERGLYHYFKEEQSLSPSDICNPNFVLSEEGTLPNFSSFKYEIKFYCENGQPKSFKIKSVGKTSYTQRVLEQYFNLE